LDLHVKSIAEIEEEMDNSLSNSHEKDKNRT